MGFWAKNAGAARGNRRFDCARFDFAHRRHRRAEDESRSTTPLFVGTAYSTAERRHLLLIKKILSSSIYSPGIFC